MRKRIAKGPLSVHAIAGTYVVLLGIDLKAAARAGVLGFAIERTDHTENEQYWLKGFKTFAATTDASLPPGALVSTLEQPVQAFLWGDYTAKPKHDYTYRVVALKGQPKNLTQSYEVAVDISTEDEDTGTHAVWFNRGVGGSQAYARRFHNLHPDQVPGGAAWTWLSRGLEEALLAFIAQAKGKRYALRCAFYEFQYASVLDALAAASKGKADVKLVIDERRNSADYPDADNRAAITAAGLDALVIPRTANPSYIAHNKFMVLLKDGKPVQVWTGSTNITAGGIYGHSNVGHLVRDPVIAAKYLDYWQQLSGDPAAGALRTWNDAATPTPVGDPPPASVGAIFSPRPSLSALEWYAARMDAAKTSAFFTAAFGVNDLLAQVLEKPKGYLRYVLLETADKNLPQLVADPNNRVAVGAVIDHSGYGRFLEEATTGLNDHVKYIHTKYLLLDPLSDDPVVISGSANFSDASTRNNDENMLVIRGDKRVADIYLGEFMRLFNHYYFRDFVNRQAAAAASNAPGCYLDDSDVWSKPYYQAGTPKLKEREYFAS